MAKYRLRRGPFKSYRELARRLSAGGRLELPRPDACARCGTDCRFTKDGHYFRSFVFLDAVAAHVAVQRYECGRLSNATFTALAAFQEPGAHYAVDVPGEILDRVFVRGESIRTAWRRVRRRKGGGGLARSTASRWCDRFRRRAPRLGAFLRAHLAQRLPGERGPASGDPGAVIRLACAGFRLHRRQPRWRFWEWLHGTLRTAARRPLLGSADSRLGRDRRPHVLVLPVDPSDRLRLRPSQRKEQPHERSRPEGAGGAVLAPRDRPPPGPGS